MMNFIREIIKKTGVVDFYRRFTTPRMLFPTFNSDIQRFTSSRADYFRYATYGLAIQRILDESIEGSFAETGVYQGHMSSFINKLAPEKKLYLFDTFAGFKEEDCVNKEDFERFKDTSVESVLSRIAHPGNVIIRKGFVPDTFQGLEGEKFAFVLLDLDVYDPTKSSLEFFYPRLNSKGYLIVHDYNNPESDWACKRAVNEFFEDKPEKPVEIADNFGSVIIRKI